MSGTRSNTIYHGVRTPIGRVSKTIYHGVEFQNEASFRIMDQVSKADYQFFNTYYQITRE